MFESKINRLRSLFMDRRLCKVQTWIYSCLIDADKDFIENMLIRKRIYNRVGFNSFSHLNFKVDIIFFYTAVEK